MAYTRYSGRHRIITVRQSNSCFGVKLKRPAGSAGAEYPNPIGRVCYRDRGGWEYSYVGSGGQHHAPTKTAAVKRVVSGYRSWIGDTTLSGSRRRRRRR